MQAICVELPAFERNRARYRDDDGFGQWQAELMRDPCAGDLIEATGGLRKVRFGDKSRGKGKRGGLRVIYFYWAGGPAFWLFTLYDKDEAADLGSEQRAALKDRLKDELTARAQNETKAKPVR